VTGGGLNRIGGILVPPESGDCQGGTRVGRDVLGSAQGNGSGGGTRETIESRRENGSKKEKTEMYPHKDFQGVDKGLKKGGAPGRHGCLQKASRGETIRH